MSKRQWRLFIEDILECIGKIEKYTEDMSFDEFGKDSKTVDAVVRNLEVIGEASKNVPDEVKKQYQKIYWEGMIGLRNRIVHEYFGVDLKIVWHITKEELPALKEKMKLVLERSE